MHEIRNFAPTLLAIGVMIASPAFAEAPVPAVETIRQNPAYRDAVRSVSQQYESALRTHCTSIDLSWPDASVHVALQPTLDSQGHIEEAVWQETVPGEACGQLRRYNALTAFRNGRPFVLSLFPGDTDSSPMLQRDTVPYVALALTAAGVLPKGCHIDVLETQLPDGRPAQGSPWTERWRADACGKEYWSKVDFTPDATGTSIVASPKDVVPAK